ncbi:hypothetical protein [Polyangium jinanense]|uniref:Uncharacterized protein n=1 Tax=Polyangium jinanense TaxID=2829994 RepID=A0A9X4AT39_9BACT|nr:hypothetical protein [Polyangium jinanense]MDC3955484.1 hypothetical protein [Polyangium jinanense]MDC3981785.1 hypothetical protein [Polyangium jinanense]
MSVWIEASGEPLCLHWTILPGLELVVSRLFGKITVGYMLGTDGDEVLLRARRDDMERSRELFHLAFTWGEA